MAIKKKIDSQTLEPKFRNYNGLNFLIFSNILKMVNISNGTTIKIDFASCQNVCL